MTSGGEKVFYLSHYGTSHVYLYDQDASRAAEGTYLPALLRYSDALDEQAGRLQESLDLVYRSPAAVSDSCERPSLPSYRLASALLKDLGRMSALPQYVHASPEGGILLSFIKHGEHAAIEIHNGGEVVGVLSYPHRDSFVWQWQEDSWSAEIPKVVAFFDDMRLREHRVRPL